MALQRRFGDRAGFLVVYIREAHSCGEEGTPVINQAENICIDQPAALPGRLAIARDFVQRTGFPLPILVDGMDDVAERAYAAWPSRIYIIDENGHVVFRGKVGPFGYDAGEADAWLRARF